MQPAARLAAGIERQGWGQQQGRAVGALGGGAGVAGAAAATMLVVVLLGLRGPAQAQAGQKQ
ncbi:MAG: hypothetical protein EOO56_20985 [Hymenobacter sp.]|nr:MAG: hypothetical protein EOO56_20985 [Hymenobacter sp.]